MLKNNQQGIATVAIIAIIVALIAAGGAAYVLTDGFGTNKENSNNTTSNISSDMENAKKDVEDNQGKSIPDGFPSDMPIYDPSSVITASKKENNYRVGLHTRAADESTVLAFYKTELEKAGWSPDENLASSNVIAVKKGNWSGDVTVIEPKSVENAGVTISIRLTEE